MPNKKKFDVKGFLESTDQIATALVEEPWAIDLYGDEHDPSTCPECLEEQKILDEMQKKERDKKK
tara:strand:- start:233 stop:427 length:195 start_codon:yes stop_codon:yes gene_type:complete